MLELGLFCRSLGICSIRFVETKNIFLPNFNPSRGSSEAPAAHWAQSPHPLHHAMRPEQLSAYHKVAPAPLDTARYSKLKHAKQCCYTMRNMSYSYQMVSHFYFDFFGIILFFPGMARFVSVVNVVVLSVIVSTVSLLEVFSALEATPSSHYPACLIPERSCRILQYLGSGGKTGNRLGSGCQVASESRSLCNSH